MYFLALAADYDGTLAHHGVVAKATHDVLERFKQTGRRLILVTGRDLPDLKHVFPRLQVFDRVVAENGALIYDPTSEAESVIGPPPPAAFVETLKRRKVSPLSVGRSIVATWEPHGTTVLEVIRDLGLELQIIFNRGAVMVLPQGINKAAGLAAALQELNLSPANVVGVGDAENDHAFLRYCGCAVAVANALRSVKEDADIVLRGHHGAGVIELVEMISRGDAAIVQPRRHGILVGTERSGREAYLQPHCGTVLIVGSSGIGKSTLARALTERMNEKKLEFCIFDPEGDYDELENAVSIGDAKTPPNDAEAIALLRKLSANVVINTQALSVADRPSFFAKLLPHVQSLRARTGRPHWLLVDEAHHLLAASQHDAEYVLPQKLSATIFITVHPDAVSSQVLQGVEFVLALGAGANQSIATFCQVIGAAPPAAVRVERDEVAFWARSSSEGALPVRPILPRQSRNRHARKYAEGELAEDVSFYFRGPDDQLNLRAQNLMIFKQIAEGVDEYTWDHHRRAGDYSTWFRDVIKDAELAQEAAAVESDQTLDASESRRRIIDAVSRRYTAPARAHRDE